MTRNIKALVFDVFGTVVDWRSGVSRDLSELFTTKTIDADPVAFADAWRGCYQPAMDKVRCGLHPWENIDGLHRAALDSLLEDWKIGDVTDDERDWLNRAWHRLDPWPDVITGLTRLRKEFIVSTLSNGNVALLVNMAKRAGLPWDCILSAEVFRHYKFDPEVYLGAADILGLKPREVMLVAAHNDDLSAAAKVGLCTAFVARPREHGPHQKTDLKAEAEYTIIAQDFVDLAHQLGA